MLSYSPLTPTRSLSLSLFIPPVMCRADTGSNAGYAVVYECVKCVSRIYPSHTLLEQAAAMISRFIASDNHNLKYLGVNGLAMIVQV